MTETDAAPEGQDGPICEDDVCRSILEEVKGMLLRIIVRLGEPGTSRDEAAAALESVCQRIDRAQPS